MQLEQLKMMIKYEGYTGISLDGFNVRQLRNLKQICQLVSGMPEFKNIDKDMENLDNLSLDEIRSLSRAFCEKYFNLHDVYTVGLDTMKNKAIEAQSSRTYEEAKNKIES